MSLRQTLNICMLEDDSDDRYLTQEVTENLGFDLHIDFFSSSHDLLNSLAEKNADLILLDYNSTPENGLDVLKKLKRIDGAKSIPVVILSDSLEPRHRNECYAAGASAVVIKPRSMQETKRKISSFFTYWTEVVER